MAAAVAVAEPRALRQVVLLTSTATAPPLAEFAEQSRVVMPGSQNGILLMASRR
jgi:16S rRNA (guanine527-N7)-methyltransferase